nr:protein SPIRAL1-like 1 [Tanacetum cinerariifolium]
MNRGVSSGGGQSSLNYLFGGGEAPKAAPKAKATQAASCETPAANNVPAAKPDLVSPPVEVTKQIPAGIDSNVSNNYFRADGQNTGNFTTAFSYSLRHTIQESDINGICDNKAIRIDVGMSQGCINGLPEVLEITKNSGLRIITSNPVYQQKQQLDSVADDCNRIKDPIGVAVSA